MCSNVVRSMASVENFQNQEIRFIYSALKQKFWFSDKIAANKPAALNYLLPFALLVYTVYVIRLFSKFELLRYLSYNRRFFEMNFVYKPSEFTIKKRLSSGWNQTQHNKKCKNLI